MARFCDGCGHPLTDNVLFCDKCGKKIPLQQHTATNQYPPASPPAGRPPAAVNAYAVPPQKRKSKAGLVIGLSLGAVALVVLAVIGISLIAIAANGNQPKGTKDISATKEPSASKAELIPFPEELKVNAGDIKVHCTYTSPDNIIPANYRSMDSIVFMQCWTDTGKTNLMVTVEIPEFTQKYEQMIEVSRAETELTIRPPLLENAAQALNSSKDAQLIVTVQDLNSNKIILQDTKPVKLYSRYDMQWQDKDGTPYDENILAWVTPEAPEIDQMLRLTADSCNELTNGGLNAIIGYQQHGDWTKEDITYTQVFSMMYTLAAKYNVKYIMAPFSSTSSDLQSVATPSKVINNAGGLCVETAVTMASAIERTNMHAVIILLPGHAQVAVETWYNSGEYYLIETTALDAAAAKEYDKVVTYKNKDQWRQYLAQDGVVAIDCELAQKLHIQSID